MKKRKILPTVLIVLAILVLVGIQFLGPYLAPIVGRPIYLVEPAPEKTGERAFEYMDAMGLYTGEDEWKNAREEYRKRLTSVNSKEELVTVLEEAVKVAGGKHSFLLKNDAADAEDYMPPEIEKDGSLLTIALPPFTGTEQQGKKYADTIADALQDPKIENVIVDLRENTGGDMGPMVSGLSPLLPDGTVMNFVLADGERTEVVLENGTVQGGGSAVAVDHPEKREDVSVALLIGNDTASSGEAVLLAFSGLKAPTFGEPTAGYTSANTVLPLTKDLSMVLMMSAFETRDGILYRDDPIAPDHPSDDPLDVATHYLQQ